MSSYAAWLWSALPSSPFAFPLRRLYSFLFKRLLGAFFSPSEVDLAALDVSLTSGDVRLHRLQVNPSLLHSTSLHLPFTVASASIEEVHAHVPWTALLTEACTLHVKGLRIHLTPTPPPVSDAVEADVPAASGVWAALADSLQGLDAEELRHQLRLHRRLTANLSRSNQAAEAIDEGEKMKAEAERSDNSGRPSAGQGRGNRRPSREATEDETAGGGAADGEEGGKAEGDVATAGLQVVASFLERLVSTTEVAVEDVAVTLDCPHPTEDERTAQLTLHISRLAYSDLPSLLRPQLSDPPSPSSSSSSSSRPSSLFGPSFAYSKRVAVHGLRVTLSEPLRDSTGAESDEGGRPRTIAHADVEQQCEVRLSVDMKGGGTGEGEKAADGGRATVEAAVHLRSLRALLTPHQLRLLMRTAEALGESSHNAAKAMDRTRTGGGDGGEEKDEWEGRRSSPPRSPSTGPPLRAAAVRGGGSSRPLSSAPSRASSASAPLASLRLWGVDFRLSFASLMVLEEEEAPRSEWWLEPLVRPSSDCPSPSALLSPLIPNISVDHLLLSARRLRLSLAQYSTRSTTSFTVHRLSVFEYLQQYRLMVSTLPSLHSGRVASTDRSPSPVYEEQQNRMGFSARRLLSFGLSGGEERGEDADEEEAAAVGSRSSVPHVQCEVETAVVGQLPPASFPSLSFSSAAPDPAVSSFSASSASRVFVQLAAAEVEVDLGVLARLDCLAFALTAASAAPPLSAPPPVDSSTAASASASPSPSASSFVLLAPHLLLRLLFPADTPSQSGVPTPLMDDGVQGCFDSRGKVRGERLELHMDAFRLLHRQGGEAAAVPNDAERTWKAEFEGVAVDLLYPKEERQMTPAMFRQRPPGAPRWSVTDPAAFHCQRLLTSAFSLSAPSDAASFLSPRLPPSSVTLLLRSARPLVGSPSDSSAPRAADADALFLDSLPDYRWFEAAEAAPAPSISSTASSPPSSFSSAPVSAAPSAIAFERSAGENSALLVRVALSAATCEVSKVELDLLLLLHSIYDEIATGQRVDEPPDSAASVHFSLHSDGGGRGSSAPAAPPAPFIAGPASHAMTSLVVPTSPLSPSSSQSDSDESDSSEMFESVFGADSVFLRPSASPTVRRLPGGGSSADAAEAEDSSEVEDAEDEKALLSPDLSPPPLSDLDSDEGREERDGAGGEDGEASLIRSVWLGRSQELRSSGGRRVTQRSTASLSSSSTFLSNSAVFHSFLSAPPALRSSTVLPSVSLFHPKAVQPYKFIRAPFHPAPVAGVSEAAQHRHRLSFSLSIQRGCVCLREELQPLPLFAVVDPSTPVPPSSTLPPHSFLLYASGLELFLCSGYDGSDVSYVSVRLADATLREFDEVVVADEFFTAPSRPLLFKTMRDAQEPPHALFSSAALPDLAAWTNPVFIGSFILRGRPELHLRETTAVLNLRALTFSLDVQSDWLAKLTDFFTLTAPPYVQTVGAVVQLTADYRSVDPAPLREEGKGEWEDEGPQPPPMVQDLVHVHFHCYDTLVDYNPLDEEGRAVLLVDHFHLHTTRHPLSKDSEVEMELRDAALLLLPRSAKSRPHVAVSVVDVEPPHLHHLPSSFSSASSYLEDVGFARVVSADFIDVAVKVRDEAERLKAQGREPGTVVEVSNGRLDVLSCSDSAALLLHLLRHLTAQLRTAATVGHSDAERPPMLLVAATQTEAEMKGDTPEAVEAKEGKEEKCDDGEVKEQKMGEENMADEERKSRGDPLFIVRPSAPLSPVPVSGESSPPPAPFSAPTTALSVALQEAAERELDRGRRERAIGRSIVELRRAERGREQERAKGLHMSVVRAVEDEGNDGGPSEQRARWFSRHEMEERDVRAAVEEGRDRAEDAVDEEEGRRRRAEELRWAEQLEAEVERRRERQRRKVGQVSGRFLPLQPDVKDEHVPRPKKGDDEAAAAKGRAGSGRRALQLLHLLDQGEGEDAEPQEAPDVELLIYDVTVVWTLFDGRDWRDDTGKEEGGGGEADGGGRRGRVDVAEVFHEEEHRDRSEAELWPSSAGDLPPPLSTPTIDEFYVPSYLPSPPLPPLRPVSSALPPFSFVTSPVLRGVRHTDRVMELRFSQFNARAAVFPPTASTAVSLSLDVGSLDVVDCVATSHFRKFLGLDPRPLPRAEQRSARQGLMRWEAVQRRRPTGGDAWRLQGNCRPLRLNVDQDAAEMLLTFFSQAAALLPPSPSASRAPPSAESPPWVKRFSLTLPLHLCVDYRPRRLSFSALTGGDFAQLLHLFPIEHLTLTLKALTVVESPLEAALSSALNEWVDDVGRHQLHRYLSSIQPLRSLVNVGSGVVDCVVLPYEQLQRPKGRVVRGMKKGVSSLVQHVTVEGLNLLIHVAGTAQSLLREVETLTALTPLPLSAAQGMGGAREASPKTLREGLHCAYDSLSRALQVASHQLIAVPSDDWRAAGRGGGGGSGGSAAHLRSSHSPHPSPSSTAASARSMVRAMPAVLLGPMIGLTDGVRKAMMAVQNVVDPTLGVERDLKLKRPTQ